MTVKMKGWRRYYIAYFTMIGVGVRYLKMSPLLPTTIITTTPKTTILPSTIKQPYHQQVQFSLREDQLLLLLQCSVHVYSHLFQKRLLEEIVD